MKPLAAKSASKGPGDQSAKQEGLSNMDTRHSYDVTDDPSVSKKGEGGPDTAKVRGTVQPARPQGLSRPLILRDRIIANSDLQLEGDGLTLEEGDLLKGSS